MLSPARLTAEEALDLYPYRWGIERMFFDLKEVLNLNRVYAANPNAVAIQVYAAAIVYNGMRVAQSEAAAHLGWPPEDISPAKFFPKLAVALHLHLQEQHWARQFHRRGSRAHPQLIHRRQTWAHTASTTINVERRSGPAVDGAIARAASLEVTGPCPRRSPLPGEVILAAMYLSPDDRIGLYILIRQFGPGPPPGSTGDSAVSTTASSRSPGFQAVCRRPIGLASIRLRSAQRCGEHRCPHMRPC